MINFEFNSANLDGEAQAILAQQAAWIRANPQVKLRIYGHTDLVGSNAYNQRLGQRRAQAAVAYLQSQGVRRGQVEAVASFGETRPLVYTQNRERLNRRTVTQVIGLDRNVSGLDFDGKVANRIYNGYAFGGGDGGN
jgi:outer membrane protein OmpA-like peptidoglycan-associated protein